MNRQQQTPDQVVAVIDHATLLASECVEHIEGMLETLSRLKCTQISTRDAAVAICTFAACLEDAEVDAENAVELVDEWLSIANQEREGKLLDVCGESFRHYHDLVVNRAVFDAYRHVLGMFLCGGRLIKPGELLILRSDTAEKFVDCNPFFVDQMFRQLTERLACWEQLTTATIRDHLTVESAIAKKEYRRSIAAPTKSDLKSDTKVDPQKKPRRLNDLNSRFYRFVDRKLNGRRPKYGELREIAVAFVARNESYTGELESLVDQYSRHKRRFRQSDA